jgi:hypothetical protein
MVPLSEKLYDIYVAQIVEIVSISATTGTGLVLIPILGLGLGVGVMFMQSYVKI